MSQRCTYCGKTRTQHKGRACVDIQGFKKVLRERLRNPADDGPEVALIRFFLKYPEGNGPDTLNILKYICSSNS